MYSLNDLIVEIEKVLDNMKGESRLHPDWITQVIMNQHPDIAGSDSDFYTITSRVEVRSQVRKRLNRYKIDLKAEPDRQITMPGFERLQERYLINEDGEQVAIRVQDMSREQRQQKAAELRKMGAGCYQHAEELDRYDAGMAA